MLRSVRVNCNALMGSGGMARVPSLEHPLTRCVKEVVKRHGDSLEGVELEWAAGGFDGPCDDPFEKHLKNVVKVDYY